MDVERVYDWAVVDTEDCNEDGGCMALLVEFYDADYRVVGAEKFFDDEGLVDVLVDRRLGREGDLLYD